MPPLSPEIAILLASARAGPVESALLKAIEREPDWTALIGMALHHGTAGLLCRQVLDIAADMLPDDLRAAMGAYLESCAERQRVAITELLELLDALDRAGIAALPFKGPAFAVRAYAEPALRPCLDLDVLIREADIDAALALLGRLGFVSQYPALRADHQQAYHRYNGQDCLTAPHRAMPVEPHWRLAPRTLAVALDPEALFRRARSVVLGERSLPTLSAEDMLLVAGLHGSKEEWARLIWTADIAALLSSHPDLDVESVLARATASGIRRMLLIGVALAADLLEMPCAAAFAAALAADPESRRLAGWAAARLWRQRQAASVFAFSPFRWRMREHLGDRVHYAAATLLTPRVKHFQTVDLPPHLRRLYPLVRVGHDFVALPLWHLIRARGRQRER